jgi:hypothetical protein
MAEFRLKVPDELFYSMQAKLGGAKMTEIARDALSLLNWAADERVRGRVVLSGTEDGEKLTRITLPSLDRVRATG